MADKKMDHLMFLIVFIIVVHSVLTVYWLILHKSSFKQTDLYHQNMAEIQDEHDQQSQKYMETPILPLTPNPITTTSNPLPWYFKDGTIRPTRVQKSFSSEIRTSRIWPQGKPNDDRIEEQLMFVPSHYQYDNASIKSILIYNDFIYEDWYIDAEQSELRFNDCPVNKCSFTKNILEAPNVDAIIFHNQYSKPNHKKSSKQVWILLILESAYYTKLSSNQNNKMINWTATYRHDSDIVLPYGRWAYYNPSMTQIDNFDRNYAQAKTKQVAMILDHCDTDNKRLQYAKKLAEYISVDIYGSCAGQFEDINLDDFSLMLNQEYKFFLAFENSNCIDYVTTKFFFYGLQHNVLPIVMGARPKDYKRMAPKRSYLHVDNYKSPELLARHLHRLDKEDDRYNEYFRWKGTGEFIDTKFFCRLCAMLHDDQAPAKHYQNLDDWWSGPGVCRVPEDTNQ